MCLRTYVSLYFKYNSSGDNSAVNSKMDGNTSNVKVTRPVEETLFDQFSASFCNESPQEALLAGFSELHKNRNLLEILDLVQDYEADEEVLYKKGLI